MDDWWSTDVDHLITGHDWKGLQPELTLQLSPTRPHQGNSSTELVPAFRRASIAEGSHGRAGTAVDKYCSPTPSAGRTTSCRPGRREIAAKAHLPFSHVGLPTVLMTELKILKKKKQKQKRTAGLQLWLCPCNIWLCLSYLMGSIKPGCGCCYWGVPAGKEVALRA
ncbi:uncharacterized protein LOC115075492 isoform X2 [Rhinatrema bivittatum]|uniref:uncharacterized protein LOC115075492 isoform X2 n=1 Tax=Rhinatrema bivittatum TaxID=194408 RepID=UPI00112D0464|nr:uncharacterized protein LOC115075492 isoform X2 [Rhinatrema bivittatum]